MPNHKTTPADLRPSADAIPADPRAALQYLKLQSRAAVAVGVSRRDEAVDALTDIRTSSDNLDAVLEDVAENGDNGELFIYALVPIGRVELTAIACPLRRP